MANRALGVLGALGACLWLSTSAPRADEPGESPFLPRITGQEDFLYVWTVGIEGLGNGRDQLVTIAANPGHSRYGAVVSRVSLDGRPGLHHGGFTDDRRQLWVGGLDDGAIYVFDVASDPARPRLAKRIDDFVEKSGGAPGPTGFLALPGRMLLVGVAPSVDADGRTALVEYAADGTHLRTTWLPEDAEYGYELRAHAALNRLLSSSFTARPNQLRPLAEVLEDEGALGRFGSTLVVWNLRTRTPLQLLDLPGGPVALRWALQPRHYHAFATTALNSRLWGIFQTDDGRFEAEELEPIGDPGERPLPLALSLSSDDRFLFVTTYREGKVRVFDVADPQAPQLVHERALGGRVGAVAQSWDGRRVYFTSSWLPAWDAGRGDEEHWVGAFRWNGRTLEPGFRVDFHAEGLGRPRDLRLGQLALHGDAAPGN